jgi:LemA protein
MSEWLEPGSGTREEFRQVYLREQEQLARARAERRRRAWRAGALLGAFILIFGGYSVLTYNSLVAKREAVRSRWSQVENQMQRRADLIPNLVNTVRGITKQELEVFTRITEARARLLAPGATPEERVQANAQIETLLPQLRVQVLSLAEQYPELRSNETFQRLMDELAGSENRIAVARRDYIQAVQDYNIATSRFPAVLVARLLGFQRAEDYFKAAPEATRVPQVQF